MKKLVVEEIKNPKNEGVPARFAWVAPLQARLSARC